MKSVTNSSYRASASAPDSAPTGRIPVRTRIKDNARSGIETGRLQTLLLYAGKLTSPEQALGIVK